MSLQFRAGIGKTGLSWWTRHSQEAEIVPERVKPTPWSPQCLQYPLSIFVANLSNTLGRLEQQPRLTSDSWNNFPSA